MSIVGGRTLKALIVVTALVLSGCALAPVAPPPAQNAPTLGRPASIAPATVPQPKATVAGFSAYEKAALRIRNIGCSDLSVGSGFPIADHVLVTNRHVVAGAAVLQVSSYDGRDIRVNAVGAAVVADIALVWTSETLPAPISLAHANPPEGAEITVVGYPLGGQLTTTQGRVLSYGPDPLGSSPLPMMYNSAPIEHGSSGSPVIDAAGNLVGVAYAGGGGQYVAVPVEAVQNILNSRSYSSRSTCS